MNEKIKRTWFWLPRTQHNSLRQNLKDAFLMALLLLAWYFAPDARSWTLAVMAIVGYVLMDLAVRYFDIYHELLMDILIRGFYIGLLTSAGLLLAYFLDERSAFLAVLPIIAGALLSVVNEFPWERWLLAFARWLPGAVEWLIVFIWGLLRWLIGGLWELILTLRDMRRGSHQDEELPQLQRQG